MARINRSKDLLAKLAAQNGGGGGGGDSGGGGFSTPSAGGFGGYGQPAASSPYGGGGGGGAVGSGADASYGGMGDGSYGGGGGGRDSGYGGGYGGGATGPADAYGAASSFGRAGALDGSYMSTGGGGDAGYGMGRTDYGMGGSSGLGGGGMGGGSMGGMGGGGMGGGGMGGGSMGGMGGGGMGGMGGMGQGMQMGHGGTGGGRPQGNPQLAKLAELISVLKPACRVESLGEQLLGADTQKRYEVKKGAKKTYVFNERVVTVNTHMGAWSMTVAKNEPAHLDVKPRRTISGNNVQLLRVHTVRVDTDFDSFRLTDHREELRAVEELVLTYQCASTDFVETLTTELEGCMVLDAGGRFGGIRMGMKPRCAHLLRYGDRIMEKLQHGVENLSFGPKKVKKAMKHKVGPVTRYETRWIEANAGEITIYKVRRSRR